MSTLRVRSWLGSVTMVAVLSACFAACGGGGDGDTSGSGAASNTGGAGSGNASSGSTMSGSSTSSGGNVSACANAATFTGDATYYAATGAGSCSFEASPEKPLLVGAMNAPDYANSAVCGTCAHLKGPIGEVTVQIVDLCPECKHGDIDLSPDAFEKIGLIADGRVTINWQFVPCDVAGPIVYHFKEGSNQWWSAVQIRNHRHAIAKFEWQSADGVWHDVPRVDYNYFIDDKGMGPGPYTFRVTDVEGGVVQDSGIPFVEAGNSVGASQFPACGM